LIVYRTASEVLKTLETHANDIRHHARGVATANSDLDFVVEFERKSFDNYMDLKIFLEGLFGCRVDLVLADAIKPKLRAAILGEALHATGF
jgi:uncharacterized protein